MLLLMKLLLKLSNQEKPLPKKAIANSKLIYVENDTIALDLINEYGPEHFIVCTANDDFILTK
jgi:histidinol dehydrogenase